MTRRRVAGVYKFSPIIVKRLMTGTETVLAGVGIHASPLSFMQWVIHRYTGRLFCSDCVFFYIVFGFTAIVLATHVKDT